MRAVSPLVALLLPVLAQAGLPLGTTFQGESKFRRLVAQAVDVRDVVPHVRVIDGALRFGLPGGVG